MSGGGPVFDVSPSCGSAATADRLGGIALPAARGRSRAPGTVNVRGVQSGRRDSPSRTFILGAGAA
ncbi:hypothetical protein GCM10010182_61990 [Actinomadura cremea]|nr:hypothetical protein GCM10010182_61990 [Actinomadura cremea]